MSLLLARGTKCPKCGSDQHLEIRDWSEISRDGDVWCYKCNTYIRSLDT